jgi:hypothetical protein
MEHMKKIKEILLEHIYSEVTENIDCVNTEELGEAIDMVKDLAEAIYYCTVVAAMEHPTHHDDKKVEEVIKK